MYKLYLTDEYLQVADKVSSHLEEILKERLDKTTQLQNDINDSYRHEDLYLVMAEVSIEKEMVENLIKSLKEYTIRKKEKIKKKGFFE